jgi:polyferredoxin
LSNLAKIGDNKLSKVIIGLLITLWTLTPLYFLLTEVLTYINRLFIYGMYQINLMDIK